MFWTVLTFIALFLMLRKLAWKPMLAMIDQREKSIRDALEQGERAKADAEKLLGEQKDLNEQARRESRELLERSKQDAERARESMLVKAREEAEKLVAEGKQAIEQEKKAALQEIRTTAADLALGAAARLIDVNVDDARQRELAQTFVDELEASASD
jgi:F-type H+-transporting ATPase subunit b